jgi:formylglycine-generating enzyme required for sulfatase activity
MPKPKVVTITRHRATAQYFTEALGNGPGLDMVLVHGGIFLMGSPEDEVDRLDNEGPQHELRVASFFMAKYPITQAQWRVVAGLPPMERSLDPDPSKFKGDNHPVEFVNWYEAVEFCDRLSRLTGREYRLPSEAEWEYACRAGTTTPFHVGETITTDLANYRGVNDHGLEWIGNYDQGPKGIYRQETTEMGSFPPNAFGLYDMHGNVWEWCQDHWHDNYKDAPRDGKPWLFPEERKSGNDHDRVLRGGSWISPPRSCRSACRDLAYLATRNDDLGFRVVCSAARALP